ncbi:MAG TPA: 4Fe-4S single cluster domain-containing protein [Kofleriaceae bacterium]|nr:4Fe-4S single cluster domain-containing protein [Kofleriaceae bacterium]
MKVRVHAIERGSRANGPGARLVVWFQGCTLGCPGCFNPSTHPAAGPLTTVAAVIDDLAAAARAGAVEGLTLSGGEPMQQAGAALELLLAARRLGLSTLMFSGYTREEITAQALGPAVLAHLDVLVDGRYRSDLRDGAGAGLRGSSNQRIHLLTARHADADVTATPVAEVRIAADGTVVLTGVDPLKARSLLRR